MESFMIGFRYFFEDRCIGRFEFDFFVGLISWWIDWCEEGGNTASRRLQGKCKVDKGKK